MRPPSLHMKRSTDMYTLMIKLIDIFGNDSLHVFDVEVK